jgi:hypothetical protein
LRPQAAHVEAALHFYTHVIADERELAYDDFL